MTDGRRATSATARIVKVLGIFTGVQGIQMLCSVVRVKLVALWIGAAGIGLFGIFNSALEMISTLSQLGLRTSAVRSIASAPRQSLYATVLAVRRWAWILGLFGALATLALAVPLSRFSFGDASHAWSFALLAVAVLLSALSAAEGAVFQGLKRLQRLAHGATWGTVGGLLVSIPMYRFWGVESIAPSIVAFAACSWIGLGFYRERVPSSEEKSSWGESLAMGRSLVILGAFLTVSEFLTAFVSFVFMSWLNTNGSEAETGYFQAGFTIVNRYLGVVFTAISMEFFPRLAGMAGSRRGSSLAVSHEISVVLTVVLPAVALLTAFDRPVITLLYKSDFLVMTTFVTWAATGTVFRAVSWCMAFAILARGDGKAYLWSEALSALFYLLCNMICYRLWGLESLGAAYVAWYASYTVVVAVIYYRRLGLTLRNSAIKMAAAVTLTAAACAAARTWLGWETAAVMAIAATAGCLYILKFRLLKARGGLPAVFRGRRQAD